MSEAIVIEELGPGALRAELEALSAVLIDCVEGGASVSFMAPLAPAKAQAFWREVAQAVERGAKAVLIARHPTLGLVGTVSLVLDLPENQPHRAEVSKMLVARHARRLGIGQALMRAVEDLAKARGKTLLTLDTVSGETGDKLYRAQGFQEVGAIPGFAHYPDGRPCPTTIFYKILPR